MEHGRCYDAPGFLSSKDFYDDVNKILDKHPDLHLTLAHFYFLSDELEKADRFLAAHPNVCFDITPGKEMYSSFTANPTESKAFFRKYADRIFFGTDLNDTDGFHYHCDLYHLVRDMLNGSEPFDLWNNHYIPMKLEKEVCDKIFYENHRALLGDVPKPIDRKAVSEELERLYKSYNLLDEKDKSVLDILIDFFK